MEETVDSKDSNAKMDLRVQYMAMPSNEVNGPELWTFDMESPVPPYQATCNRVLDFLYVGGHLAAESDEWLRQMRITCVINVRKVEVQNKISGVEYVNIEVDDDVYEPIHWYFDQVVEKIEAHRKENGSVLINCEMGISRSATMCMVYLVCHRGCSLRQAYYDLKRLRPCIYPNNYFWENMVKYEKKVRGQASVSMRKTGWCRPIPDVYLN